MGLYVVLADGRRFELGDIKFSDMVAFEKHFDIPSSRFQEDGNRAEWMAFMLWRSVRRQDPSAAPELDAFVENIAEFGERGAEASDTESSDEDGDEEPG